MTITIVRKWNVTMKVWRELGHYIVADYLKAHALDADDTFDVKLKSDERIATIKFKTISSYEFMNEDDFYEVKEDLFRDERSDIFNLLKIGVHFTDIKTMECKKEQIFIME